jgi:ABC-type branched-subunit amino acid transport system substrate-binding protein
MTTRRAFLSGAGAAVAFGSAPRRAVGADAVVVGLVVPGASAAATAFERGALLGLADANALASMFGKRLTLEVETAADGASAAASAAALARRARALAVVGGHDFDVAEALGRAADGAVFLNVGSDDDRLRNERCARPTFHVAPSQAMAADGLVGWLAQRRSVTSWAVVGDGTPRAHALEAAFGRAIARRRGSLASAEMPEAVHLLALDGAPLRDAVARARAAGRADRVAGLGADVASTSGPEEAAGFWIVGWHHELERFSGRELNRRFTRRFAAPMDARSWAAWAALKLVGEGVTRAHATDGAALAGFFLSSPPFDGHKGTALTFRPWDRQLRQTLHVLGPRRREDITERRGPFAVLADVPGPDLDAIGTGQGESRCRLSS